MNERYHQQIILPSLGKRAQERLHHARVVIIGVGGLGCPCATYLAAAGIGTITLCDGDTVTLSNLHRQVLFTEDAIGQKKVIAAQHVLQRLNSDIQINVLDEYVSEETVSEVIHDKHLIIDCTDNFRTRFIVSEEAARKNIPYLLAANFQLEGQLALFAHTASEPNLKQLFPQLVKEPENCNQRGALGPVLGVLGNLQALEAINWITQQPHRLENEWLMIDLQRYAFERFSFGNKIIVPRMSKEITAQDFERKLNDAHCMIIDVRQPGESPTVEFPHRLFPLNEWPNWAPELPKDKEIILFCHSGIRSAEALDILESEFGLDQVKHLKGGILQYEYYKQQHAS